MSDPTIHQKKYIKIVAGIALVLILVSVGYNIKQYKTNKNLITKTKDLEEAVKNSNDSIARIQTEKDNLTSALLAAGEKNKSFANQLDSVTENLERLDRLTKTDPELLQKYSKVYFLNENYVPSALTDIDTKYLYNKEKALQVHDRVWPFLKEMLDAAAADGVTISISSAYRSFGTQAQLKSGYKVTYGAGTANSFSADQGYSEHQLGTALDFTSAKINGGLTTSFEKTDAFTWLENNAHRFGFILSYPPANAYYVYEPWHWRFIGIELATKLKNENERFYDLDQREISPFLINIFNR